MSPTPRQARVAGCRVRISTMPPVARPYSTSKPPGMSSTDSIMSTGITAVSPPRWVTPGTGTPSMRYQESVPLVPRMTRSPPPPPSYEKATPGMLRTASSASPRAPGRAATSSCETSSPPGRAGASGTTGVTSMVSPSSMMGSSSGWADAGAAAPSAAARAKYLMGLLAPGDDGGHRDPGEDRQPDAERDADHPA